MNGTVKKRTIKKGMDKHGKSKENLTVYDVYYRFPDPLTGELKQTSKKGFRSKTEADDFLFEVNRQIADNIYVTVKKLTFREYLLEWLDNYVDCNLKKTTAEGYRRLIEKHIIPALGNIELQNLSARHLESFYAEKLKNGRLDGDGGLSLKSLLYIHRIISVSLVHAVKKKIISKNPISEIMNTPKPKKRKGAFYTPQQIKELLKAFEDTALELPIALAVLTGLRRGEILGLRYSDIDFENKTISVRQQLVEVNKQLIFDEPKSDESKRNITIPDFLIALLQREKERKEINALALGDNYIDQDLIVCKPNGEPIKPKSFSKQFGTELKEKGLKPIRFHDLRHSCASLMLSAGVPLKVTSEILGHSTISITADLYSHVINEQKKDAADKVNKSIFGNKSLE